ncbi:Rv2175c family DNA-binding protein [Microvirga sesbaniae]|uniref:Rv2175c family DNA-binding protein n=1 Tax=Microvirga sesbaniae TaxID=681392 RepID=UPI0021C985FB|nr:Rv2175c family DNA-binding protein [Microvirga sp. HBU67692]
MGRTQEKLAAEGAIIALPLPGGTAYPACQLEIGGTVTGLPGALRSMPIRSPRILEWLLSGDPALGGAAPIEALRRGNVTEVIQLARLHGAG